MKQPSTLNLFYVLFSCLTLSLSHTHSLYVCVSLCGCVLSSRFQANRSPLTVWSRWSRRNAWKWWPWIPTIKNLVSLCCLHDKLVLKQKHLWILRANELVITPQTVDDSPDPWKMFFKKRTSQFIAYVLDLKHRITNEATGRLYFWSKGTCFSC